MNWLRVVSGLLLLLALNVAQAQESNTFRTDIQPFLKTYCVDCHNEQKPSAELNLTKYQSAAALADDFRQWEHVVTFVRSEEMPPDDAKKPSADERTKFLISLQSLLHAEAKKLAGDPGVVLPRRLSNAEYNYTIRDLTGVDIRPADAFPIDPASGEGFSNTGEALLMSPGLFKKYYAAAQQVADHIDLTPTGWSFAPFAANTYADQKKLHEQKLLDFYSQHDVSLEEYLLAAWSFRHRPAAQQQATIEQWAADRKLSGKYLSKLHNTLEGKPADVKFFARFLRERWQAIPGSDNHETIPAAATQQVRALAADIQRLSKQLCVPETAAIVGNAGNGPIQHIERRSKMAAARDMFNQALLSHARRFHAEYRDINKQDKIRVVLQVNNLDAATDSTAVVLLKNLNFSTSDHFNYRPSDPQRNTSLLEILKESSPDQFAKLQVGRHPRGGDLEENSFALVSGATLELEVPTEDLPEGKNFYLYVEAELDRERSTAGAVQLFLLNRLATDQLPEWTMPLVDAEHKIAQELRTACESLCAVFPNRFCYVDNTRGLSAGFHLIEGFFRDDQPLCKLVLSEGEKRELDRLWEELNFGTQIAERMLRGFVFFERSERNFMKARAFDAFKEEDPELATLEMVQRLEDTYFLASNLQKLDGEERTSHPIHKFFADIRNGLSLRKKQLQEAKDGYLQQIERFAARAFRRPLTEQELAQLRTFFQKLSEQPEHGVEQAVRASILRVLVSPHFCYRLNPSPPGNSVQPLSDLALASRLSYFLWSSLPDEELLQLARDGKLRDEQVLLTQTRRMMRSPKVSGFALEFFGPWLKYRDFLEQESVSRAVFPNFDEALKQAMFEEPTRFATKLIQQNKPITELLHSDVTLVNKRLAQHYNLPYSDEKNEWQEVSGLREKGRSGVLGMAVFLTKNSQPQRTSPVKRGFWVVHQLLGEHIPPPPPDVVALPAKETDTGGKTIRELLKLHTDDAKCARCHVRFDDVGLAMEGFDAIGRARSKDLAGRAIDNLVPLPSGKEVRGVPEFAAYLATERADDFCKTLSHKLLGYALGRSLQLSDQPLLDEMQEKLRNNDRRFGTLIESIVAGPQFLNQRCRDFSSTAFRNDSASGAKP